MGLLSSLFGGSKSDEQQAKQDKKNFEILKYDGVRAFQMRQIAYAIKCFEQAVSINEEPETLRLLANAYTADSRTDDARETLNRLTAAVPTDAHAWLQLAQVCFVQEDYTAMNDACQKAIAIDDRNATAYYLAGKAARGLNDGLQTIVMLTKALAQDENHVLSLQLRAEVLADMGQAKEALEDAERILSLNADDEEALLLKGKIQALLGNTDEALALCIRVTEVNPFNEKAYLLRVELLETQSRYDEALLLCDEAIELMPQMASLYQIRGQVRLLKGDKDGSLSDVKKALELNPEGETQINGSFDNFGSSRTPGIY